MNKTAITWTDATWNPTTGCSKVSAGCKHCYAERLFPRAYGAGRAFTEVRTHEDRLAQPMGMRASKIFVNSMSDLFHEDIPVEFIDKVLTTIALTPRHSYQVLTKRPERMGDYFHELYAGRAYDVAKFAGERFEVAMASFASGLPQLWLGVSIEDRASAAERIPLLLQTQAAIRFLSVEPLLEAIDLTFEIGRAMLDLEMFNGPDLGIHWVIVGGESGPGARLCELAWIRDIVRQCIAAQVPVFVKQLGSDPVFGSEAEARQFPILHHKGADFSEWPPDIQHQEFPR